MSDRGLVWFDGEYVHFVRIILKLESAAKQSGQRARQRQPYAHTVLLLFGIDRLVERLEDA